MTDTSAPTMSVGSVAEDETYRLPSTGALRATSVPPLLGPRRSPTKRDRYVRWSVAALVAVGLCSGIALRLWFLFHQPITADEATVGLMATQILHGHFSAFYWARTTAGVSPMSWPSSSPLLGTGRWQLELAPILLSVAVAVLTWRVVRRLVGGGAVSVLAGMLVFATPEAFVWHSTVESGFRGVTMVLGMGVVLMAVRIFEGRTDRSEFVGLGLVAGMGWWSSPEIVYFLVPAGVLGVAAVRGRGGSLGRSRFGFALVGGAVGALPWLWANVRSGLASFSSRGSHTAFQSTFLGHLQTFFQYSLPIELGLRRVSSGAWISGNHGSGTVARILLVVLCLAVVAAVAGSVVICLRLPNPGRVIGFAVLAFPLLYAASPVTWYWPDGRFVVLGGPLIVVLLAVACHAIGANRRRQGREGTRSGWSGVALFSVVAVTAVALSVGSFAGGSGQGLASFSTGWTNPDGPTLAAIATLESAGVRYGYADYWVAYKLDFLSGGRLTFTDADGKGEGEADRSTLIDAAVRQAPVQAWLFVPPSQLAPGVARNSGRRPGSPTPTVNRNRSSSPTWVGSMSACGSCTPESSMPSSPIGRFPLPSCPRWRRPRGERRRLSAQGRARSRRARYGAVTLPVARAT